MSTHEIKTWIFACDQCRQSSKKIERYARPHTPPEGWAYVTRTRKLDDTYAPPQYEVLLCPDCVRKEGESS